MARAEIEHKLRICYGWRWRQGDSQAGHADQDADLGFYLQNNNHIEEMVHSDFDGEYIILAVVIYKSLSQRKTLFIILTFSTTKQANLRLFFSSSQRSWLKWNDLLSGSLVLRVLVIELNSEGISPNTMSLTKKTQHPKLVRAKKIIMGIHFSVPCSDQVPLGIWAAVDLHLNSSSGKHLTNITWN